MRPASAQDDAEALGTLCADAFDRFNHSVGLPDEFPCLAVSVGLQRSLLADSGVASFVAVEGDNKGHAEGGSIEASYLGSNHVDNRGTWAGVGPITVMPRAQNFGGVGRALMRAAVDAARAADPERVVCLQQISANTKSFSLYVRLSF